MKWSHPWANYLYINKHLSHKIGYPSPKMICVCNFGILGNQLVIHMKLLFAFFLFNFQNEYYYNLQLLLQLKNCITTNLMSNLSFNKWLLLHWMDEGERLRSLSHKQVPIAAISSYGNFKCTIHVLTYQVFCVFMLIVVLVYSYSFYW